MRLAQRSLSPCCRPRVEKLSLLFLYHHSLYLLIGTCSFDSLRPLLIIEDSIDFCSRGIEVFFGWEMTKVAYNEYGQKIATFRNVDSGEVIEKDFFTGVINPPSKPHQELVTSGITNGDGVVDVNPYTLQHKRYENIFAFGDCIGVNTTRT